MPTEQERINAVLEAAHSHPLQIYFNSIVNSIGPGDVSTVLLRNNDVVAVLHMSISTAKTYGQLLSSAVSQLEKHIGHEIMSAQDITAKVLASEEHSEPHRNEDDEKRAS